MADPKIYIRRSGVPNKVPTDNQLSLGELAVNTRDGKLYLKQDQTAVGLGSTVIAVNPWSVGVGTNSYNTYFDVGSVGIGTTTPVSKLDVRGTISIGRTDVVGINSIRSVIDINSWEYYGIFKSVTAEDTAPSDIYFNDDGTKMYILGDTGNDVNEYSLSTPWEVNTATFTTVFSVAAQETAPLGLYFKPDGTRMYICGNTAVSPSGADQVRSYTLSTPWSIASGVTYDSKAYTVSDTAPQGVYLKDDDGTKMYVVGSTGDAVYEYTLSTAWELDSTITLVNTLLIGATNTLNLPLTLLTPVGIDFNASGTKMYIIDQTRDIVSRFDLATPWDTTTAKFFDNVYIGFQELTPTGVFYQESASRAYVIGSSGDTVYQYNTDVPSLEFASSGISTRSSVIINNETRLNDKLYVTNTAHFSSPVTLKQTLQVDSNLTVSGGTITTGNVAAALLGGNSTTAITFAGALTTGTLIIGGTTQTGTMTIGRSTSAHTLDIASGVTLATNQKTVNIGAGGTSGTRTLISLGANTAGAISTVTIPTPTNLIIGSATTTGTESQPLQVTGGVYVSGNLGIGTTNPIAKLDVLGDVNITGVVTASAFVGDGSLLTNLPSTGGGSSQWVTTSAGIHTLSNVGIGTTNPMVKLDILGDVNVTGVITASSFSGNATSSTYANVAGVSTYANTSGIATYATTAGIATYASTAGISTYATTAGIATNLSATSSVNTTGIITATSYSGSGTNLTGIVTSISAGNGVSVDQSTGKVTITASTTDHKILDNISSSFNGSTTQFTISSGSVNFLNSEITSAARLLISVGGVVQQPDPTQTNGYYISGGTNLTTDPIKINFVEAPKAGQQFFGVAYGLTTSPVEPFVTQEQSIAYSIVFGV